MINTGMDGRVERTATTIRKDNDTGIGRHDATRTIKECPYCGTKFKSAWSFRKHRRMFHDLEIKRY